MHGTSANHVTRGSARGRDDGRNMGGDNPHPRPDAQVADETEPRSGDRDPTAREREAEWTARNKGETHALKGGSQK